MPDLTKVVTQSARRLPNRYGLHAVEHWGKTSFAAQFPGVIVIQAKGETGLETLINEGRLPEIPHFPEANSWEELMGYCDALLNQEHNYRVVALDTINGIEPLCHEYCCRQDFEGSMESFLAYAKGPEAALPYWRELLAKLDRMRVEKGMTVIVLSHTKVKNFKNPEGADYDRFTPDMHEKTWSLTFRWCDAVFFGNFETTLTQVSTPKKGTHKGKALGGSHRVLFTERTAAYDAKNRIGLDALVDMGESAEEAFGNFKTALVEARERNKTELSGATEETKQ